MEWLEISDVHRNVIRRSIFGPEKWKLADRNSEIEKTFFKFLSKLIDRLKRQKWRSHHTSCAVEPQCNHLGIPIGPYNQWFSLRLVTNIDKSNYDLRNMESNVVDGYAYALALFVLFENKLKLNKLRKLRHDQKCLPIAAKRAEIIETLLNNQVVIIAGDTGCGKSTQIPQYLLEANYDRITCTQPRRIAATNLAYRVSHETLDEYGSKIAYQIRFEKTRTLRTRLLFLTEGILLRQMQMDKNLDQFDVIILDEVHERNLNSDFLMGLLRGLIHRRPDLKLILMSATINLELFQAYFADAPVLKVSGRLYPIEIHYLPVEEYEDRVSTKKKPKVDPAPYLNVLQMIDGKYDKSERGDALIFLNGVSEIGVVAEALKVHAESTKRWVILILHSTLMTEEQEKVFDVAPSGVRKCIISTNIAETSVTIDQIRFVIDSGKVNLMKYDAKTKMQSLREYWTSQASADQRKGRAGRTGPGVCYRLYSTEQFEKMDKFTISEIHRVSLENLAMQIVSMDIGVLPKDFPFIEPPNMIALDEAVDALISQGVLVSDCKSSLTPLGRIIASIPVDIPIAKILIYGGILNQIETALTIAASLSVSTVFTARSANDSEMLKRRDDLMSDFGDLYSYLNVFRKFAKKQMDRANIREWSFEKGVDVQRMYEMNQLRRQFKDLLVSGKIIDKTTDENSKKRRINIGDRKKLLELKKDARHEIKKRKVLRADSHFDSVKYEEAGSTLAEDVQAMQFYIENREAGMLGIYDSHRFTASSLVVIGFMVFSGVYPQYAVLDQYNHYKAGNELYAHTRSKPFIQLHPNGSLALCPDALHYDQSDQNLSRYHQLIVYASLIETTKPFICNTIRVPALMLVVLAKSVQCSEMDHSILCDDFVYFKFIRPLDFFGMVEKAVSIRRRLAASIKQRIDGNLSMQRSLINDIVAFSDYSIEYKMTRRACPKENIEVGFILPSGENLVEDLVEENFADYFTASLLDSEQSVEDDDISMNRIQYFCEKCNKKLYFESNFDILRHKRSHN